jgi:hypothetical protein
MGRRVLIDAADGGAIGHYPPSAADLGNAKERQTQNA